MGLPVAGCLPALKNRLSRAARWQTLHKMLI